MHLEHGWMDREHGKAVKERVPAYNIENTEACPTLSKSVPVISWVQAGHACEAIDLYDVGCSDDWVTPSCPVKDHTYALRVQGDSMAPLFTQGMILVIEPAMDHDIGDYVIAKNGNEEATFKQLVSDSGKYFLKPVNPQYPTIPMEGYKVIGVVRDAILKLK